MTTTPAPTSSALAEPIDVPVRDDEAEWQAERARRRAAAITIRRVEDTQPAPTMSQLDGMLANVAFLRAAATTPVEPPNTRKPRAKRARKRNITAELMRAMRAAEVERGIPTRAALRWLEIQLWDNPPTQNPAHVRFRLKLAMTDRDVTRFSHRHRANRTEALVDLSTVKQFMERWKRQKEKNASADLMMRALDRIEGAVAANAAPGYPVLAGWLVAKGVRGLGTLRFAGAFAVVTWHVRFGLIVPDVTLCCPDGGEITLAVMPALHENPRACTYYACWYADRHGADADEILAEAEPVTP